MKTLNALLSGAVTILAAASCSTSSEQSMQTRSSSDTASSKRESSLAAPNVQYQGGPVLSHVNVHAVYWGNAVPNHDDLNRFYGDVTTSPYFDWLAEYDTPTQTIGRGSFAGELVDANPPGGARVTDQMVQDELARLIDSGSLPAPGSDDLYMVHFPPSVTVTMKAWWSSGQTLATCAQLCGYHGTFTHGGANVYYGVLPDVGGACAGGCGDGTKLQNQTAMASHELVEAVTDPAISLATGIQAPLAWWDSANWEIGDMCEFDTDKLGSWTVQTQFSMKWDKCIATAPSVTNLVNGVPVRGIGGDSGHHSPHFKLDVPSGATNLVFTFSRGTMLHPNAGLYVHYGSPAANRRYDCSAGSGANDGPWTCVIAAPQPGSYYALIEAWSPEGTFQGCELEATYDAP